MIKFARVVRACFSFVRTATAHECEAVWFGWMWENGSWVDEFCRWVFVELLEECLALRWSYVAEEIAWVAVLSTSVSWDSGSEARTCIRRGGRVVSVPCVWW
jgi:hypothetical protein